MQLKLLCHSGTANCDQAAQNCENIMCSRELMLKVIRSLVRSQLVPVIYRIFEIEELFRLADVSCLGENQLYHVIRMCDRVSHLKDDCLAQLGIEYESLMTAILFHDCGKGPEVDDKVFSTDTCRPGKVPKKLRGYGVPDWVQYYIPLHDHVKRSLEIAETYNLREDLLEAVALHHHVKILPEVLDCVARGLHLPAVIREDILHHKPEQYAARGSVLAQVLAIADQLSAIERKFEGRIYLAPEPEKMEDELVKDLVIGLTDAFDPRVSLLGNRFDGNETVILFDLRDFGSFVDRNSEFKVQATKREVLNTIRSVVRVQDHRRDKDLVGLVGGDEYAVITKVRDHVIIDKMIERIKAAVKTRTGLGLRYGFGIGGSIETNFHEARRRAQLQK